MSRAFVKESDENPLEPLPERVVSAHPNLVTPAGLRQIEAQVQGLERERTVAREAGDRSTLARVERDLRYWTQRRVSARVLEPADPPDVVRFGVRVTLRFADGSERAFRLVGEDEADPAHGLLSWAAPLGTTLMGAAIGDELDVLGRRAEIVAIDS